MPFNSDPLFNAVNSCRRTKIRDYRLEQIIYKMIRSGHGYGGRERAQLSFILHRARGIVRLSGHDDVLPTAETFVGWLKSYIDAAVDEARGIGRHTRDEFCRAGISTLPLSRGVRLPPIPMFIAGQPILEMSVTTGRKTDMYPKTTIGKSAHLV